MKILKRVVSLLCIGLLLPGLAHPAAAAEASQPVDATIAVSAETLPQKVEPEFGMVSVLEGCRTINGMKPLGGSDKKLDTAQAAFLYDMDTQTVVYSYNPDATVPAGTLTKIMTCLVGLENAGLQDTITINTNNISRLPAGSTVKDLKNGETVTVEDLIACMLMENANDAAVVLAEYISGNQSSFVTLMNQKALQLGCTNTKFENVHGLETATSVTSARDMAKIVNAAIQNEDFKRIWGLEEYTVDPTEKSEARKLLTTNYFLSNRTIPDFYTDDVYGGMQSMTNSGGASIVVTAQRKNKANYIAVVMGATRTYKENGWSVLVWGNFNEMAALLTHGFERYKVNRIIYDGMSLSPFSVIGGECNVVGEAKVNVDSVVPINSQMDNLIMNFSVVDGGLTAPIKKGDLIATMELQYLNSVMTEVEVYAMGDVLQADKTGVTIRSTALRSDSDDSGIMGIIGTICVLILGLTAVYLGFNAYMRSRMRARRKKRRADRRRMR